MRRALGAVCLLALLLAFLPGSAGAQETSGELTLLSQTSWVPADGLFRLRVAVEGVEEPDELTKLDVEVALHPRVRSRSEFTHTLDGARLRSAIAETIVPAGPAGAGVVEVTFAQPGAGLVAGTGVGELDPGVYPVSVRLLERGGAIVDEFTTHLLRSTADPGLPPLSVGVVVPFSAPPALQPDGSVEIGAGQRGRLTAIAEAIDVAGAPLTLVPTPETVRALADLGDDDVLDGLRRSVDQGSEVLARPYVELSDAVLVEPRLANEVTVQRLVGAATIQDVLGTRPRPGVLTALDELDARITGDLDELGIDQLVLTDDALQPLTTDATDGRTLVNPFVVDGGDGEPLPAVVADPGLVRHFSDTDTQVLAAHHLLADLAVLFGDSPALRRGTVVMPPADWDPSGPFLRTVLEGLASAPSMAPVTITDLLDTVPPLVDTDTDEPVVRTLVTGSAARSDRADVAAISVDDERARVAAVASITGPDNADLALLERLLLVSQAAQLSDAERATYLSTVEASVVDITDSVSILDTGAYRLTARTGTIPVTLRNDNEFPVVVQLRLASDKLVFDDAAAGDPGLLVRQETLRPGNNPISVEVTARTSGDFPLELELASPDGLLRVDDLRVTVRSTVASGVGVGLSIGAGLFLLVWWARHWRTARRDRRLVAADTDANELEAAVAAEEPV